MMAKNEPITWITVKGNRVPIMEGQSKEDAVNNFLNKQSKSKTVSSKTNADDKEKRIADNEAKIEKLERELNEEMSSTQNNHSVNWRRDMQTKIRELRDENRNLKYGNKQSDDQKNISKNEDEKEAQITRNQKEAEARKAEENRPVKELHEAKIKELESDKYEGDNTYDLDTLKPVSFKDGYQVTFCQIGDNYTNDQYQTKVNECLKLSSNGKTYAGKFEGTPEISFHCANREQAIAYARANNQISIWDWKAMQDAINHPDQPELWAFCEIKTGGTGRRK